MPILSVEIFILAFKVNICLKMINSLKNTYSIHVL